MFDGEFEKMVMIEQKAIELLDTFVVNKGRVKAKSIILDCLKKDAVDKRMRLIRGASLYEKRAREYYNKYGTSGEF